MIILNLAATSSRAEFIEGFPEGCAFASIQAPLPDHQLRFGRVRWEGGYWIFFYVDENMPGPLLMAPVAQNLGMIGLDPGLYFSVDLRAITPYDNFVIAQVLNRDIIGQPPIVTCVSRVFTGTIRPYRPIPYGPDYYQEVERYRNVGWDDYKSERFRTWRKNSEHIRSLWREIHRKKDREKSLDRRRALSPTPNIRKNWDRKRGMGQTPINLFPDDQPNHKKKPGKSIHYRYDPQNANPKAASAIREQVQPDMPLRKRTDKKGYGNAIHRIRLDDDDDDQREMPPEQTRKRKTPLRPGQLVRKSIAPKAARASI